VDPAGRRPPRNLTEGVGRERDLRFRYVQLDDEQESIPVDEPMLLSAFDRTTKAFGYYRDAVRGSDRPQRLVMLDERFGFRLSKAEDADVVVFTRESFRQFPDLWASDLSFRDMRKLSDANPQMAEYRWGTAELVHWRSTDGTPLDGILYKPDGFDPSQRYPMMVYFYETMSDNLHGFQQPGPGGSSVSVSFYVSRGYVVFVPDIHYRIGHPGESALDCVVPGVLSVLAMGFVDPERIGVQGHSWGGYQIAYLVTQTNIFAAAEAGAPVSNMTSAYGGIRWGTGMSRMFQYERTQSRIGATLWDAEPLYIENSPLFRANKIETPVLMLHNDDDSAVPWYQGIEFFVALRRLGKPVWLLNYNGEPHGLVKYQNRKDFAVRMQQFFDHYLKGAPEPVWMAEGVPAVLKGRTLGLDLIEPDTAGAERGRYASRTDGSSTTPGARADRSGLPRVSGRRVRCGPSDSVRRTAYRCYGKPRFSRSSPTDTVWSGQTHHIRRWEGIGSTGRGANRDGYHIPSGLADDQRESGGWCGARVCGHARVRGRCGSDRLGRGACRAGGGAACGAVRLDTLRRLSELRAGVQPGERAGAYARADLRGE